MTHADWTRPRCRARRSSHRSCSSSTSTRAAASFARASSAASATGSTRRRARTAQLTIHGDRLLLDDLASPTAQLRFDPSAAADSDGDHDVTLAELHAVDLSTLPLGEYGTAANGTIYTLAQFIAAQTRSLVHFQGEGGCAIR